MAAQGVSKKESVNKRTRAASLIITLSSIRCTPNICTGSNLQTRPTDLGDLLRVALQLPRHKHEDGRGAARVEDHGLDGRVAGASGLPRVGLRERLALPKVVIAHGVPRERHTGVVQRSGGGGLRLRCLRCMRRLRRLRRGNRFRAAWLMVVVVVVVVVWWWWCRNPPAALANSRRISSDSSSLNQNVLILL